MTRKALVIFLFNRNIEFHFITYIFFHLSTYHCHPYFCGNAFDEELCTCTPYDMRRYSKKLSGPIIDRIDLYVEIYRLNDREILDEERGDTSKDIRTRVVKAREIQNLRFTDKLNRDMRNSEIEKYCVLNTNERVFADAKQLHGMRYTQYRGLAKVKMELTLKVTCMNLKN